jgi:hypothetical protein
MLNESSTRVAGIYYCRGHVSGINKGDLLRLLREPQNPHDANAIRVEISDGTLLGRIPRIVATSLAREIDSGSKVYAIVQWTSSGHSGRAPSYGRGGRRQAAVKPSPPECQITIRVENGDHTQPPTPHSKTVHTTTPVSPKIPPDSSQPQTVPPKSGCFVVTAVFRDADHPTVSALRQWRDTSLARHRAGRLFIRGYNLSGPGLARIVNRVPCSRRWLAPMLAFVARVVDRTRKFTGP